MPVKYTLSDFLTKAKEFHGDRYDYSETEFNGMTRNLTVICREHGSFEKQANIHLGYRGDVQAQCPYCNGKVPYTEEITQEWLRKWYLYEPDTGIFRIRATGKDIRNFDGRYYNIAINSTTKQLVRMIFLYMINKVPDVIDHKDMDKKNNRWDNLRATTIALNTLNQGRDRIQRRSSGSYFIKVQIDGKQQQKTFQTLEEAQTASVRVDKNIQKIMDDYHNRWLVQDIV